MIQPQFGLPTFDTPPKFCSIRSFKLITTCGTLADFRHRGVRQLVIPIPKPGKDHSDTRNFRPVALTSCLCKTMERMSNARLMWSLESQGLFSEKQCGFRKNHSTLEHLVRFETLIRNAPAYSCVFEPENTILFEAAESKVPPLGTWRNPNST